MVAVPNDTCEEQFSDEYLDWLYINQLQNVDTLIVVDREIATSGSLIVDTTGDVRAVPVQPTAPAPDSADG